MPTLGRKVRLFLEWNWGMLFPPDIAHLGYARGRRPQAVVPTRFDDAAMDSASRARMHSDRSRVSESAPSHMGGTGADMDEPMPEAGGA